MNKFENIDIYTADPCVAMDMVARTPWDHYVPPYEVVSGVYSVSGIEWVSSFLIDTGDGLILIDTGLHESVYLLIDSIYRLGFKLNDIRMILLSHMHSDHANGARALAELTHAKVYMSKRDMPLLNEKKLMYCNENYTYGDLQPENFYEDEPIISLGNIRIETVPTPGHTPGTTSFFYEVSDNVHGKLNVGMHGGLGLNTMSREYLEDAGFPLSLRDEYKASLDQLDLRQVDVSLISHNGHHNMIEQLPQKTETFNPYIDDQVWHKLLGKYKAAINDLIKHDP